MLRAIGHDAALLDGGLHAWPEAELHTNSPRPRPPASFTAKPWPEQLLVTVDDVAATRDVLIDARDRGRFAGGPDPVDPRSGHIPGREERANTRAPGRPGPDRQPGSAAQDLRSRGNRAGTPVISYCGSGVTACHNLLALERAGLGPARLFPGSWSQWSRDPGRAAETTNEADVIR